MPVSRHSRLGTAPDIGEPVFLQEPPPQPLRRHGRLNLLSALWCALLCVSRLQGDH